MTTDLAENFEVLKKCVFHDIVSRQITSFRIDWTPLSKGSQKPILKKNVTPRLKISKFKKKRKKVHFHDSVSRRITSF